MTVVVLAGFYTMHVLYVCKVNISELWVNCCCCDRLWLGYDWRLTLSVEFLSDFCTSTSATSLRRRTTMPGFSSLVSSSSCSLLWCRPYLHVSQFTISYCCFIFIIIIINIIIINHTRGTYVQDRKAQYNLSCTHLFISHAVKSKFVSKSCCLLNFFYTFTHNLIFQVCHIGWFENWLKLSWERLKTEPSDWKPDFQIRSKCDWYKKSKPQLLMTWLFLGAQHRWFY